MEAGKVLAVEASHFHERNGQRISHHHLYRRTAGGGQVIPAGFLVNRCIQYDGCLFSQYGSHIANDSYKRVAEIADKAQQHLDLGAFSALAEDKDDVLLLHHAQITVDSVCGMQEYRWSTSGIKGGYDLLRDDGAFADATDDHPAFTIKNKTRGLLEFFVQKPFQGRFRCRFHPYRIPACFENIDALAHKRFRKPTPKMRTIGPTLILCLLIPSAGRHFHFRYKSNPIADTGVLSLYF